MEFLTPISTSTALPLPAQKYDCIVMDPPWPNETRVTFQNVSHEALYARMSIRELERLDVPSLASDQCVCVMWTTAMFLVDAIHLLEHWGFKHIKPLFVWTKVTNNNRLMGCRPSRHYPRRCTEFVLVARRGRLFDQAAIVDDTIWAPRSTHSTKPEEFWRRLEAWLGDRFPRRIELFARARRPGWDAWGLETPCEEDEPTRSPPAHD